VYEVRECDDGFAHTAPGVADAYTEVVYLWQSMDGAGGAVASQMVRGA